MRRARVFAPATIGNVGPGFDVLGLAIDGLGDTVEVRLDVKENEVIVTGRDALLLPKSMTKNAAAIAARAYLAKKGYKGGVRIYVLKGLPMSGGLGGSAASSVGGALAAAIALDEPYTDDDVLLAALRGEAAVAGTHFDNLAPCLYGGLTCVLPAIGKGAPRVCRIGVHRDWWVALVSPSHQLETRRARAVLPKQMKTQQWVEQMARTTALAYAFAAGDVSLARHALVDRFAETARAKLIPSFAKVKKAAEKAGAIGASISGAGPSVFALCEDMMTASKAARAMQDAFGKVESTAHVGRIDKLGARKVQH